MPTPSAVLVVVGTEVLSAKVQDENGPWAARRLHELGVRLVAIETVADRVEEVVDAVRRARGRGVDWVFTSGGVGPTHDDLTVGAVAQALGWRVARSPEMVEAIRGIHREHHGEEPPEAALRMADVPEGTRLLGDPRYPTLVAANVVMLPGVPQFFRFQFDAIAHLLEAPPFHLANVFLSVGEGPVAQLLDAVARAFPDVEVGSYPRFDATDHRVKVTLESKDAARVRAALAELLGALPAGSVVRSEGP